MKLYDLGFSFLAVLSLAVITQSSEDCVYTVYVRTGTIFKGGTDSTIGLTLYDSNGNSVTVGDLVSWGGLMSPDHDYFERGNLDIFSGRAGCLDAPPCALNLTSDGSGPHHGWYCNYVEVTATGPHTTCGQQLFSVEQWLATDAYPYELCTVRNNCPYYEGRSRSSGNRVGLGSA